MNGRKFVELPQKLQSMKKTMYAGIILFLIFSFSGVFAQAPITQLPDFHFYDQGNKKFTKAQLKPNTPTIVFYFDPDCDHCQKQAGFIQKEITKFAAIQVVFVAFPASIEAITAFGRKYFPNQIGKNFHFLRDNDYLFDKFFGYSEAPSIYVFNKTGKCVKTVKKTETSVADLLSALK